MPTATEIAAGGNCLCLPPGLELSAQTFLLARLAGITDPAAIIEGAKCYQCIPDGLQLPAQIYLLNQILG